MFKKLKQKLEEGGEGGLERVNFTERLPGSIVRTSTLNNGHSQFSSGASSLSTSDRRENSTSVEEPRYNEEVASDQNQCYSQPSSDSENVVAEDSLQWDVQRPTESVPRHLVSRPPLSYQALLESRVQDLEQECSGLNKELNNAGEAHATQLSSYEHKWMALDRQVTDLKMQLIEAELERVSLQHEHEGVVEEHEGVVMDLQERLEAQEMLLRQEQHNGQETAQRLQELVEERDKVIISLENELSDLKKKAKHLEAQLQAFEKQSEDVVVSRLHSEVADVERRVQFRNVDIQILERRLAAQAKEKDEQAGMLITRLEEVEKELKVSEETMKTERSTCRSLRVAMETEQLRNKDLGQQIEQLNTRLTQQAVAQQHLENKMLDMESAHLCQVHELEACLADRDSHVRSLQQQVRDLHSEGVPMQPMLHPPGLAHRTVSVAVQTSLLLQDSLPHEDAPVLPVRKAEEEVEEKTLDAGPANMVSVTPAAELQVIRNRQNHLEEELAEKMKIMKLQQQTILDLKKELRLQQKAREPVREKSHSPSPPIRVAIASDVNFQYLKHVVIRFMCSHAEEALQLTKAISTLLEFSPQEEQHVKNFLDYKMSWFGSLPPPLFTPTQTAQQ